MRLRIELEARREILLPMNHQYALSGLVYRLLGASDAEYSRFLHDEGYRVEPEKARRFKLFTFSSIRVPRSRRETVGDCLRIRPGRVEWLLTSPLNDFLTHSATGLLTSGAEVCVGPHPFLIREVAALPEPEFMERMQFTCLSPIVASRRMPGGRTYYFRPADAEAFSEAGGATLCRSTGCFMGKRRLRIAWNCPSMLPISPTRAIAAGRRRSP